ncbi:MAG: RagB/SusD family nutrient uptake outer membrane protein [Segetibacter sp.]
MKKINILVIVFLFITSLIQSCKKDFLDEELKSSYAPENTLTDSLGLEAAIAGLQNIVRGQYTSSTAQGLLATMQVGTDVARTGLTVNEEVGFFNYPLLNSQNAGITFFWTNAYQIINNSNLIIKAANDPAVPLSNVARAGFSAEAKFFRAYAYNFLSTLWGDVPLLDEPLNKPRTDFTRTPVNEVLNFMIEDLTFSVTNLPDVSKVKKEGRINKAAARQLLAEVYLRANKPDLAEQQCKDIIASNQFKLVTTRYGIKKDQPGDPFSDMFMKGNQRLREGNTEGIWIIEQEYNFPGGATGNGGFTAVDQHHRVWVPYYSNVNGMKVADSLGGRGIGRLRLSNWVLYQIYNDSDMRNSVYNIKRKFYYNNPNTPAKFGKPVLVGAPPLGIAATDTIYKIAPYTTKWNYFNPLQDGTAFQSYKDLIMMRLGETYLLMAEAQLMQGKSVDAAASINVVRGRAGATPVMPSTVTLDYILDERARELIGEENRRITLVRTKTLVDRVKTRNAANVIGIQSFNMLLPLPQTEIDLNNGAVLAQNPGY